MSCKPCVITDMFRAYDSINDAIEDYYDMLVACSRYKGCINQADPKTCITAIKNGGYATDPAYVTTIMSIINKYNLTQYDSVVAGKSSNETVARATVRYGSRGADVTYLQQQLNSKGYNVGSVDGVYGNKTLAAVKAFQKDNELKVDGIVGPKTYAKLLG